jgi:hypothetical protein
LLRWGKESARPVIHRAGLHARQRTRELS